MSELKNKLANLLNLSKKEEEEIVLNKNRDGLFERKEYVNKKYVTNDGKQLLCETRF